ncbi:oxidoreductase [Sphaerisporangium rufum]|uniref:Oxidoreductase n=1 Tax=Sphaerisporangium rufum TaxID=1381558 RepID=A0A919R453_9ACTN|nr:FAD-dependent monooxygenase [Sphaerisporangium rufum]GII79352.1 oxidoreductase [Sphaerisporangium rufum]
MGDSPVVLVAGGGIGGLALAQALTRAGVDVRVFERGDAPDAWVSGYRIHVNQMGARSLRQCLPGPLWEAFTATAGRPGPGFRFRTETLDHLLFVEEEVMCGRATEPPDMQYAASRAVLRRLLLAGMSDVVRFGRTFERYETRPDGRVTAHFADGTSETGDVLVGADGVNSRVRAQYLPAAARVRTEATAIGGRVPLTPETQDLLPAGFGDGLNLVLPGSGCALFTASFTGRRHAAANLGLDVDLTPYGLDLGSLADEMADYVLFAYIAHRGSYPPDAAGLDGPELLDLVGRRTEGWHPELRRMLAAADPGTVRLMPFVTSTPVRRWRPGPVTVLGDAVHSMTPALGLGANVALRDAALLSSRLAAVHRGEADLVTAIGEYEERMRRYGFQAVRKAALLTDFMISGDRRLRRVAKGWFRLCDAAGPLRRLSFGGMWTDGTPQEPERLAFATS